MSEIERITALEARFNEAELKHVQTMSSLMVALHDIEDLKQFKARADQIFAALAVQSPPGTLNPSPEALLKNYEIHSEQITTWVDLLGKASIWYLAVTTAVVSYCLAKPGPTIRLAMVLPFLVGLAQIFIYSIGLRGARNTHLEIERLATRLQLHTSPDARVLTMTLWFNIGWLALVLVVIAWLFFAIPGLPPLKVMPP